jgi:hypothetical protein
MNPEDYETSLRALMQRDAKIWSEKIQLTFGKEIRDDSAENTKRHKSERSKEPAEAKSERYRPTPLTPRKPI